MKGGTADAICSLFVGSLYFLETLINKKGDIYGKSYGKSSGKIEYKNGEPKGKRKCF